jgi:hypothetical protein
MILFSFTPKNNSKGLSSTFVEEDFKDYEPKGWLQSWL